MTWCNVKIHDAVGTSSALGFPIALRGHAGLHLGRPGHAADAAGLGGLPVPARPGGDLAGQHQHGAAGRAHRAPHGHPAAARRCSRWCCTRWRHTSCCADVAAHIFHPERPHMKIAIIGQQEFGKAALEAFLARGDEVAGVFCMPEKPGAKPDALREAAQAWGLPVFQFASLRSSAAEGRMRELRRRPRRDGLCAAVRAAGVREHPAPRHHPVPPLAAAAPSRALLHQLADRAGRNADRAQHLPAHRRAGRRPGDPAEVVPHRAGRDAGRAVLQQALSDGRGRAAGSGRPGHARAATKSARRTNRRRATRAGSTRTSRASTGPATWTRSTT